MEDDAHGPSSVAAFSVGTPELVAAHFDPARVGHVERCDEMYESGLARAGGSGQDHELARLDTQARAVENRTTPVPLDHVGHLDRRR